MENELEVLLVTAFIALVVVIIHRTMGASLTVVALGGIWNLFVVRKERRQKLERS